MNKFIRTLQQGRWSFLPEFIGCAIALVLAWWLEWKTGDLIWSMWLASLVIGYSLILWKLFSPAIVLLRLRKTDPDYLKSIQITSASIAAKLFGLLFLLLFFTIHFVGFHYVHSMFVNSFYPISPGPSGKPISLDLNGYWQVVKSYAWFLPLAFLAQRSMFTLPKLNPSNNRQDAIHLAQSELPSRSEERLQRTRNHRQGTRQTLGFGEAYKNVVKLHCLIFFLAGADAAGLPEFLIYAVVYSVYFFSWEKTLGFFRAA